MMPFRKLRQLGKDLNRRVKSGLIRLNGEIDTRTVKLAKNLMEATPVDTSKALSNWQVSLNFTPPTTIGANVDGFQGTSAEASKQIAISKIKFKLSTRRFSDTIVLYNNTDYLEALNDGHSEQAPAGFIEDILSGDPITDNIEIIYPQSRL